MRIYIDCEFNGLGGSLISMALVTESGDEWYRVQEEPAVNWQAWVWENVVPVLNAEAVGPFQFSKDLEDFLVRYPGAEFIADWPADFEHLAHEMNMIGARNDFVLPIECTMTLLRGSPDIKPEIPHNALSDARALRDWHQSTLKPELYIGHDGELILKKGA